MPPSRPADERPVRVMLACSGLDHAARGFESFARDCFDALVDDERIEMTLIKGSGPDRAREHSIRTVTRHSVLARGLGRLVRREPFRIEQLAFALSLQPLLARLRPDVVYLSEWHTGLALAHLRRVLRAEFRLAYCNGAMAETGFEHLDRVQQLTPVALNTVLARGGDPRRHQLLPLGFSIGSRPPAVGADVRSAMRRRLGLPDDRTIVLSVAALNRAHKRIDYLIEEVARLPEPRPYLVMLGQAEPDTPELRELARRRLGPHGYVMGTVAPTEVDAFYRASDVLVLPSLGEAFGRVLVEAMAHGLPCVAHDYEVTRHVLGEHGHLTDLSRPGALARVLGSLVRPVQLGDRAAAERRHRFAYARFSWDVLRPSYVTFLAEAARPAVVRSGAWANSTVSSSSGEQEWTKQR